MQKLGRQLIRQCFHVKHNYDEFARQGVSNERLQQFLENPEEHGPKLSNTRLDKTGYTTKELKLSRWNQRLIFILAREAKNITKKLGGKKGYFGDVDWKKFFEDRLYRLFLNEIQSRRLDDETEEQQLVRLAERHQDKVKRNAKTNILHMVRRLLVIIDPLVHFTEISCSL